MRIFANTKIFILCIKFSATGFNLQETNMKANEWIKLGEEWFQSPDCELLGCGTLHKHVGVDHATSVFMFEVCMGFRSWYFRRDGLSVVTSCR
jgi:hypothetical protein